MKCTLPHARAHTLAISPSHSMLTPGQPVPQWPYNTRRLAGQPLQHQLSHWYDSTRKKIHGEIGDSNPRSAPEADACTTTPTRCCRKEERKTERKKEEEEEDGQVWRKSIGLHACCCHQQHCWFRILARSVR